jgi:uncharacterized protein (DUF1778 family)
MKSIQPKTEMLNIRITPEQKARLATIARQAGKRVGEFVRDLILQEIGRRGAAA